MLEWITLSRASEFYKGHGDKGKGSVEYKFRGLVAAPGPVMNSANGKNWFW